MSLVSYKDRCKLKLVRCTISNKMVDKQQCKQTKKDGKMVWVHKRYLKVTK